MFSANKFGPLDRAIYEFFVRYGKQKALHLWPFDEAKSNGTSGAMQCNKILSNDNKIDLSFSEGWIQSCKKMWNFRSFKLHCETGDVNNDAIDAGLPNLTEKIRHFKPEHVFNFDE